MTWSFRLSCGCAFILAACSSQPSAEPSDSPSLDASTEDGAPLVSYDPVCSADGWCWASPLPQGNGLRSVWGASNSDLWAVGDAGLVFRLQQGRWTPIRTDSKGDLRALWGSGPNNIWAGGEELIHWDGQSWTKTSGPSEILVLEGSAANDIWLTTAGANVYRFDGTAWNETFPPVAGVYRDVWVGAANDVWLVGDAGACVHWDGSTWQSRPEVGTRNFTGVWGTQGKGVWAISHGAGSNDRTRI
ncbi:MAG TPA: hypothetical protein PLJ27_10465, partial [Polyangiaceae bacterium]|nr:hypothetical protein [Polyangiaceae bacterium]